MSQEAVALGQPAGAGIRDRVLVLRSVDAFEGLDDEGLTLLAEHAVRRLHRQGDVLTTEGEPARAIRIVVEGRVVASRAGRPDTEVDAGRVLGMLEVLAGASSGRAVAASNTVTLEIPVEAFQTALEENHSLLRNLLRALGTSLARLRGSLPADPARPPAVELGTYVDRAPTLVERLIQLRAGPFGSLNIDALVELARNIVECRVPAGHVLWSIGDPSTHSLHVRYGRVRCTAPDGRYVDVGSDFTIGVMDVWSARRRSYEARAETEVHAWRVDFEHFLTIVETHTRVGLDALADQARWLLGGPGST